jgi:hypothetical protein
MPRDMKAHEDKSSFASLLSGWVTQGVDSFFATQRILLDLAMRQNAGVMNMLRDRLADSKHSPAAIVTEMTGEGVSNFIEAQQVLLHLAQRQNEIMMQGVKERIGDSAPAAAMANVLRRTVDTFIEMQQDFLKLASKQTHSWVESAKSGKPYTGDRFVDLAREGMEKFVHAQKRFLDVIEDETGKVTGKRVHETTKKVKRTEIAELAKEATDSFMEAQKKLFDVAGRQMQLSVKAATRARDMVRPLPFVPLADVTREGVKSFVEAQKALMDVMVKRTPQTHEPVHHTKRARAHKPHAKAAAAVA